MKSLTEDRKKMLMRIGWIQVSLEELTSEIDTMPIWEYPESLLLRMAAVSLALGDVQRILDRVVPKARRATPK